MTAMDVRIKHGGKQFPVRLDVTSAPLAFKQSIEQVTGVPVDRMKVMVKGGILKDDADMAQLGFKQDQIVTVIGSSVALPPAPEKATTFLEDMDSAMIPNQDRDPAGLINLGQTCYLNSSLQALRQIPQLHQALAQFDPASRAPEARFTTSFRNLLSGLDQTASPVPPIALLNELRTIAPQFAEMDSRGGFAQQDADEAWTQIVSALRDTLRSSSAQGSVVDDCMSIKVDKTLSTPEAPEESPTTSHETALKLECNISITTNFLMSGIMESLDQSIEKNSPTLGRVARYEQRSRLSRLPEYLTVHMVRFYWRRDIQKKAKIMRKVKYPLQLDASDLVTDELRSQIRPLNAFMKTMSQNRDDRAKQLKNARNKGEQESADKDLRAQEKEQFDNLVKESGVNDCGGNLSGMYELCAMVTHKGASADSGHYIGWARKDDGSIRPSGEESWYKFDDDKVSTVDAEKILAMDGGGQDSVAYILLYRAIRP